MNLPCAVENAGAKATGLLVMRSIMINLTMGSTVKQGTDVMAGAGLDTAIESMGRMAGSISAAAPGAAKCATC